MRQLDTENGDYNLTSQQTVLTDTPDASNPCLCQGIIYLGDGSKNLDGTGGDFEISVQIGSQTLEPDPQTVTFSTATRATVFTTAFPVPANTQVVLKVKSPNGGDTDVDVTAYLYDVGPLQPTTRGRTLGVDASDRVEAYSVKPNEWYVSKSGNDSNDGITWGQAFLTIGQAVLSASSGDTIYIGPGVYSEAVDITALSSIRMCGNGTGTQISSSAYYPLKCCDYATIENLRITASDPGNYSQAVYCYGKTGVTLRDCLCEGTADGINANTSKQLRVERCTVRGTYDGINLSSATDWMLIDSTFYTDNTYASGGQLGRAFVSNGGRGQAFNCTFYASRDDTQSYVTYAAHVIGGYLQFIDCQFIAEGLNASQGGDIIGVGGLASGQVTLIGGSVYTSNAGETNTYDFSNASGILAVSGVRYDTSKTSGTITVVPSSLTADERSAVVDAIDGESELLDTINTAVVTDIPAAQATTDGKVDAVLEDTNETIPGLIAAVADRIGAFTGSGVNTILGFLKALMSKAASTPSDVGDTFDPSTDSVEAIQETASSITGALNGEGSYTGTLTVDDGEGNGLEGAVVHARRGGILKASGTTDSNGEIANWVFGGYTYDLAVRLDHYQPETDTITVSADAWTKTISMTAISITAPSAATLCTVQFRVKLSDTAVSGAICKAKLLGTNQASDGTILSNEESSDTTDSEGIAELELVQSGSITKGSGRYKIWVEIAGQPTASIETTIPNQSAILFEDLLRA